jgi:hypothetical protein
VRLLVTGSNHFLSHSRLFRYSAFPADVSALAYCVRVSLSPDVGPNMTHRAGGIVPPAGRYHCPSAADVQVQHDSGTKQLEHVPAFLIFYLQIHVPPLPMNPFDSDPNHRALMVASSLSELQVARSAIDEYVQQQRARQAPAPSDPPPSESDSGDDHSS